MHKRIKELAKEAGLMQTKWADVELDQERVRIWQESLNNPGSLEKFAKLIIEECMQCCVKVDDADDYDGIPPDFVTGMRDGALLCKEEIKTHFGIE